MRVYWSGRNSPVAGANCQGSHSGYDFVASRRKQGYAGDMNIRQIARQSVRDYFAPLVWVWRAIYRPRDKS